MASADSVGVLLAAACARMNNNGLQNDCRWEGNWFSRFHVFLLEMSLTSKFIHITRVATNSVVSALRKTTQQFLPLGSFTNHQTARRPFGYAH